MYDALSRKMQSTKPCITLSIFMDNNNIHILHNNMDEKVSFPEELISELLLAGGGGIEFYVHTGGGSQALV